MILGIGRIDGDERQRPPILAARQGRRGGGFRFPQGCGWKDMRNAVSVDRDQACGAFRLERSEFFLDPRRRQAIAAARGDFGRNEIAIGGFQAGARWNGEFAAELLLVHRNQPAAAVRQGAEDAENALLRAIDQLDDAARMPDVLAVVAGGFGAQQRPVADAADFGRPCAPRRMNADFRRIAVRLLVPLDRNRNQFAVAVTLGNVGENDLRQASPADAASCGGVPNGLRRRVRAASV